MTRIAFAITAIGLALMPLNAAAQPAADATADTTADMTVDTTQPPSQGPMVVERLHSGFVFTPEVKVTEFDRQASGLIGGSAGWLSEETFFFGGGGYWMPDQHSNRELGYGGFVMQWFIISGDRFGLSAKGLLGGGHATTSQSVTQVVGLPTPRELDRLTPAQVNDVIRAHTVTTTVGVHQDFFVAEPEVNARIAFARHVHLTLGAGYRFAGHDWWHGYGVGFDHNNRISGAVGSVGVSIGG